MRGAIAVAAAQTLPAHSPVRVSGPGERSRWSRLGVELGGGDIVIVASVAGLGSAGGNEAVYAASKYGQVGLAVSLDRELRTRGVRVSTIAPAAVNTAFADGDGRTAGDPAKLDYLHPNDVANAVVVVLQQPRRMRTALWTLWSMSEQA